MYNLISASLMENTPEAITGYLRSAEYRNTDWFQALFNNNIMHSHSVSLTSGTEKSSYYASLSALYDPDGRRPARFRATRPTSTRPITFWTTSPST